MKKKTEGTKLNNSGFSLLEVLIAMVILCLVSIPLLHSFFTTAKTNGRAKIMMRATNCAENLLESAEYKSVEDLVVHYDASDDNTVTENFGYARWGQLTTGQTVDAAESDGAYLIEIDNEADIPVALPDEYKTTVYMYYYEGYSTKEIASAMRCPAATVRSRLARARQLLKSKLGGDFR